MSESDGRRIKRPIFIRASSVRFLNREELESVSQLDRFKSFVENKKNEIEAHNKATEANTSIPLNGRNLTNLGLFRSYIQTYLSQHPNINQKLTSGSPLTRKSYTFK